MGFLYSGCGCRCSLARGPSKLDVVDASRISPYRVITGKAVATVAPSSGNNWSLSTLTLGEVASPTESNLAILPDAICGSADRWQLSGGGRITTPAAGLEVGVVFDYRSPTQYSVAGVRTLSSNLSLGAQHEAFLRINGTEITCPVYCQVNGALIGTPWVWRRGEYVFCQLPTTSQTIATFNVLGGGTLPQHITRSGLFAHAIAEGQGQIGLWSKGHAVQCSFVNARRHNYRLPVDHKHASCAPAVNTIGAVNNYVGAYGGEKSAAVEGFAVGALFDEGIHTSPKRANFPLATYPAGLEQFIYTTEDAPNPYPDGGTMDLTDGSYCDYAWSINSSGATYRAVWTLVPAPVCPIIHFPAHRSRFTRSRWMTIAYRHASTSRSRPWMPPSASLPNTTRDGITCASK